MKNSSKASPERTGQANSYAAPAFLGSEPLLTEKQIAALLQLSPRSLRIARQQGRLAYQQFGRSIRYTAAEVSEFVGKATVANDHRPTKSTQRTPTRATAEIIPFSKL